MLIQLQKRAGRGAGNGFIIRVGCVRRLRPTPLPTTIEIVYLFCALSSCSISPFFLLQVLDIMNGNVDHVQLPYESHPFLHSHTETVHEAFEHPGFDTQFIDGPEVKIQYEFVLL